jgi:isocitrate dehydrogenase
MDSALDWAKKYELTKVVAITKRNILKKTDGLFFEVVENSVKNYPSMELQEIYIDNMAQQLVINPEQFNNSVLVSTNLFMDIISELASGIVGSIGLIYSSNMGKDYAMFEAAHGSAPSFKGQNKVNPTATILAGAWMADYLGERDIRDAIFSATNQVIDDGKYVTFDIGGNASTSQMAEQISNLAKSNLKK